jgi:hypothetical protein
LESLGFEEFFESTACGRASYPIEYHNLATAANSISTSSIDDEEEEETRVADPQHDPAADPTCPMSNEALPAVS